VSVQAYHPETGHSYTFTDEQMVHMRRAGWVDRAEYDAQEAAKAAAAEAEAAKAAKPAKNA
jgi:hypothetical protein